MSGIAPLTAIRTIALVGNPNSGKTTLFNALTGLRHKVGNYPGVTVEKKEGRMSLPDGREASLLDLPGTYSLTAGSPDERIAVEILTGAAAHTAAPDLVICVVDASNIERNLYLASQLIDRQLPLLVALNMVDLAEAAGVRVDAPLLSRELGVPVIPTVASRGTGIPELLEAASRTTTPSPRALQWRLPDPVRREFDELVALLRSRYRVPDAAASLEAIALLTAPEALEDVRDRYAPELLDHVRKDQEKLEFLGFDRQSVFVESRYEWIRNICASAVRRSDDPAPTFTDRLDRIITHRVWGYIVFFGLMALMFQAMFSWAAIPMDLIGSGFSAAGTFVANLLPPGDLRDLLVDGAIAGVASVVTFLPQIGFLFLFLGILEDSGYMARAAFIMDRLMGKVGLHGKAFIPLLGSFACAIPGIMAARTIESPRDRLVTILVAPLISCSARLPVYTLLIGAFVPPTTVLGVLSLPALVMFGLYAGGMAAALALAWALQRTLLRGTSTTFIMELPTYRLPSLRSVLLQTWEKVRHFLERAGTIILGASILLWFLATYPRSEGASAADQLRDSFAGRAGRLIEPVILPLGFDWKIGIGIVSSLLQREVFVSTMGTIYSVRDAGDGSASLAARLRADTDPATGRPLYTLATALSLLVYYMFAMQCLSTVAVVRKETGGWRWPLFQFGVMTLMAWGGAFVVYRAGVLLGGG
jgi:ferrous iron transport protein B